MFPNPFCAYQKDVKRNWYRVDELHEIITQKMTKKLFMSLVYHAIYDKILLQPSKTFTIQVGMGSNFKELKIRILLRIKNEENKKKCINAATSIFHIIH